jgi:hypothetical protein
MNCSIVDTTYILDLTISIINIYILSKDAHAQIWSKNICIYGMPHTKDMESSIINDSFI